MKPYHEILEVAPDAAPAEIRAAFRRLAFSCHPDRNPAGAAEAHQRFLELSEAFSGMMDGVRTAVAVVEEPPDPEPTRPAPEEELDLDGLKFADDDEEDDEPLSDIRSGPEPARPSVWTLREHRARVRGLARQMALADRRGRLVDAAMRGMTAVLLAMAVAALAAHLATDPAVVGLWGPLVSGLAALVAGAWYVAFREGRVDRHEMLAEEILRRRGHRIGTLPE